MDEAAEALQPTEAISLRRVLFHRNFFPYFVGNLISNSGTWFQSIAQVIFVYRLTGSLFMVGVVNFAQFAGMLIVTPLGGSIADRFDRRRLLIASQLAAAVLSGGLGALTAARLINVPILLALVLLVGVSVALTTPTMQALVSSLVGRAELPTAIALNGVTYQAARVLGPVLGALVVGELGFTWAFSLNSLSFLSMAAAVAMVRPRTSGARRPARWPRVWEGFGLLRRDRELAVVLAMGAAVSFAMDPITTLGPAFASQAFHRADTLAGLLIGVYGGGAILAAFTRDWRETASTPRLAASLAIISIGMLGFAGSPSLSFAIPALVVAGFGHLSSTAAAGARVQLSVPDELRGRLMALWTLSFLGVRPLGSLIDGTLASILGIRVAAAIMTLPAVLTGLVLLRLQAGRAER